MKKRSTATRTGKKSRALNRPTPSARSPEQSRQKASTIRHSVPLAGDPIITAEGQGLVLASLHRFRWPFGEKRPYISGNLGRVFDEAVAHGERTKAGVLVRPVHVVEAVLSVRSQLKRGTSAFLTALPPLGLAAEKQKVAAKTPSRAILTPELVAILALASSLRAKTNTEWPDVGLRHLIAACYLTNDGRAAIHATLATGTSYETSRTEFTGFLTRHASEFATLYKDNAAAWRPIIAEIAATRYEPPFAAPIPSFANDRTTLDLLGMEQDAGSIAVLASLPDVQPPLAIGLFGPWGSGKSTFMRFIKDKLAALDAGAGSTGRFRVVPVTFDAWSHADAKNLWASLTAGLFDQIGAALSEQSPGAGAKVMAEIAKRIGSGAARAPQLEEELALAEDSITRSRDALIRERATASPQVEAVQAMIADNSGERAAFLGTLLGIAPGDREKLTNAVASLVAAPSAVAVAALVVRRALRAPGIWSVSLLAAGAVFFVAIILWRWGGGALTTGYLAVSPAIALAVAVIAGGARIANAIVLPLLGAIADYDAKLRETNQRHAERITVAAKAVAEAERQRDILLAEQRAIVGFAESFGKAAAGRSPAGLLRYFIAHSPELADIRKKLGLLSTVRQCFETLQDIMATLRTDKALGDIPKSARIDRIIVFIDDLDRCREEHVVQVLQAVHLLLAFELFVVVVAVDARWLEAAVSHVYGRQLAPPEAQNGSATVADYLEKIFQLPVWIRPVTGTAAVRQFVDGVDIPEAVTAQAAARTTGEEDVDFRPELSRVAA